MRIEIIFSVLVLVFLQSCDGYRQFRVDIDLHRQSTQGESLKPSGEEYKYTIQLIDTLAAKYKLHCQSCDQGSSYRHYRDGLNLFSNTNENTDLFSIHLWEFGPLWATSKYKSLHKDLSTAIEEKYSAQSIIMNPYQCTKPYERQFVVKLHNRKPWILWFANWSIEPEFTKAAEIIDKVARKYEVTQSQCYPMPSRPCKEYKGGEFIGVEKSITMEVYGDSYDTSLHAKIIDHSCKESELEKSLYAELFEAMIEYFGNDAVKSSR